MPWAESAAQRRPSPPTPVEKLRPERRWIPGRPAIRAGLDCVPALAQQRMMCCDPYPWVRPGLFGLDAEDAHAVTVGGLRAAAACRLDSFLAPPPGLDRPVHAMGLEFPNVVGLAAGLDKTGTCVDGFGAIGFGHIEVGTITPRPQSGNPRPRLFRLVEHEAIINRMGFNNPGVESALRHVAGRRWRGILGFNIGKNRDTPMERAVDDYVVAMRAAFPCVDYLTINISSPNTAGLRDLQEESAIRSLLRTLKIEQDRLAQQFGRCTPLAVKIAPDLQSDHLASLAKIFLAEKIDGVVATNTTTSRPKVADQEVGRQTGGLSGAPLRELSTGVIRRLHSELGSAIPIVGVGGIVSAADAREKIEAGASLVQIYTGLIYRGPALVHEILAEFATT